MCIGTAENGKCLWKDLYLNLIDPAKHEAIHMPRQIKLDFFTMDVYGGLIPLPETYLNEESDGSGDGGFIQVSLDLEYVN